MCALANRYFLLTHRRIPWPGGCLRSWHSAPRITMSSSAWNRSLEVPAASVMPGLFGLRKPKSVTDTRGMFLPEAAAAVNSLRVDKHGSDHGQTCECLACVCARDRGWQRGKEGGSACFWSLYFDSTHASAPVPAPAVDTDATDYVNLQRPSYYRQNHKVPCRAHAHDLSHSRKLLSLFHPSYLTSPTHRIHGKTTAGPGSQQKAIPGNELGWRGVTVMLTVMLLPAY